MYASLGNKFVILVQLVVSSKPLHCRFSQSVEKYQVIDWNNAIGLYRDVWIAAIASSTTSLATRTAAICVRFQGRRVRRVYVTMEITFLTRKSALIYRRGLRQRVASLTLNCNGDLAIRAYYNRPFSYPIFPAKFDTLLTFASREYHAISKIH